MKCFLIKAVLFIAFFYLILKFVGFFELNADNEQHFDLRRLKCSSQFDSLDILFLGSSYTYSSLNPVVFAASGYKSYNLGISGTGVYFIELLLEDYLRNHKKPKVIVFDISLLSFAGSSDDFTAYPIHRYLNQPISHEALILRYFNKKQIYSKLLAKSLKKGLIGLLSKPEIAQNLLFEQDSIDKYRGFYVNHDTANSQSLKKDRSVLKMLIREEFDQKKLETFLILVDNCSKKDIKIYWYEAPTANLHRYFNAFYKMQYIYALAKLRAIDLAVEIPFKEMVLNSNDYRNTDHLNFNGAEKLSKYMLRFIQKNEN
jgi:hypothetical protein